MSGTSTPERDLGDRVIRRLAREGITLPERWCLRCGLSLLESARDAARLLFSAPPGERPDALIVGDDNFVEAAIAGVVDAGCSVPGDVPVVSLWNFPQPPPPGLVFHRVGLDCIAILTECLRFCRDLHEDAHQPTPADHRRLPSGGAGVATDHIRPSATAAPAPPPKPRPTPQIFRPDPAKNP